MLSDSQNQLNARVSGNCTEILRDTTSVENVRFSILTALKQSDLLAHVNAFLKSLSVIGSMDGHSAPAALVDKTHAMLRLKKASENFNCSLKPVNDEHKKILQELKLEQLLSKKYWHALFLANSVSTHNTSELDNLSAKLSNAKLVLTDICVADNTTDTMPLASANPQHRTTGDATARSGIVFGLVTGMCAVLLSVLAIGAFVPDVLQQLHKLVLPGSITYRLLMIALLLTLTTFCFLMISKWMATGSSMTMPLVSVQSDKSTLAGLFDFGASPRRIIIGALGPVMLGLGQGISISAGFGTFGFSVLLDGLFQTFQLPFWLSQSVITVACFLLAWIWGRVPFGLGTITTLLLIGPAISFGASLPPDSLSFIGNLLAFITGLLLFAGGISLAAAAALGPDGVTALSLAAERKHGWSVSRATFLWDITAIAAGMILGGNFGIATVIGLFTVPFLIHLFIPPLRRLLE